MKQEKLKTNPAAQLEEQVLSYVQRRGILTVQELYTELAKLNPTLTEFEVTDTVWRLTEQGKTELEDVPPAFNSLAGFLRLWERNFSIYASLIVSLATVVAVYTLPSQLPFVALRWALGLIFVLFVPGYVTLKVIFPERGLDTVERLALSVGLSLAIVPLVGLLLNFTPWGIRLTPIVASLFLLTTGLAGIALGRKYLQSATTPAGENP